MRVNKGVAHYYLDQTDLAIQSYEKALLYQKNNTTALYNL